MVQQPVLIDDAHYDAREAKARTLLNQVAVAVKTAVVKSRSRRRRRPEIMRKRSQLKSTIQNG